MTVGKLLRIQRQTTNHIVIKLSPRYSCPSTGKSPSSYPELYVHVRKLDNYSFKHFCIQCNARYSADDL